MATPTTTSISVSESQHVMTDSGIISSSTTSLRLASSSCSTSGSSASMMMPKVRMPNLSESIMNTSPTVSNNIGSNSMQDSGISCSTELMMRLSLSSGSSSAESSSRNGQTQSSKYLKISELYYSFSCRYFLFYTFPFLLQPSTVKILKPGENILNLMKMVTFNFTWPLPKALPM